MNISTKGIAELFGHEGLCLSPYLDSVGVVTIGFGATNSEIPGLSLNHPDLTMKEAVELFHISIKKYENAVNNTLKVNLSQERFDALVSICYNIGCGGLAGSTFMKLINSGIALRSWAIGFVEDPVALSPLDRTDRSVVYYETPVHGLLNLSVGDAIMMWNKPKEIINRRKKEVKLFSSGVYSNGGKCLVFPVNANHKPVYAKGTSVNVEDVLK